MIDQEYYVAGRTKVLSRHPSPPIESIADRISIYHPEDGGMCEKSPVNTIGSMIIALLAGRTERVRQLGLVVPLGISKPVEILRRVSISIYKGKDAYDETGVIADQVLFKRCGRPLGLVLSGDLAGLFVRPIRGRSIRKGLSAVRVWNDGEADPQNLPYQPNFSEILGSYPIIVDHTGIINPGCIKDDEYKPVAEELVLSMKLGYEQLIRQVIKEKGRAVSNIDVFFSLCRRLSIPVDEAAFHYTRQNLPEEETGFNSLLFQ